MLKVLNYMHALIGTVTKNSDHCFVTISINISISLLPYGMLGEHHKIFCCPSNFFIDKLKCSLFCRKE